MTSSSVSRRRARAPAAGVPSVLSTSQYDQSEQKTYSSTRVTYSSDVTGDTKETLLFKQHARIHLFNLASVFHLYDKPHYRKGSYRDDLVDNLRNVAIPGTGIPLSLFVRSKILALGFVLIAYNMLLLSTFCFDYSSCD